MSCSTKETAMKEKIGEICAEFNNDRNELIAILHKSQGHFGFLPAEVQEAIANVCIFPYPRCSA